MLMQLYICVQYDISIIDIIHPLPVSNVLQPCVAVVAFKREYTHIPKYLEVIMIMIIHCTLNHY